VAKVLSGSLTFNPATDTIPDAKGNPVKLEAPEAPELPARGFMRDETGFQPPAKEGEAVEVVVAAKSERLQLLEPFAPWDGKDIVNARVLAKALGKCTTDHISAAGKWLRYRGHLDNISNNLLIGATNAFTNEIGKGRNLRTGEIGRTFPETARDYKVSGIPWIVVGDANYGEGSSREHAALEPRFLGGAAIVTKSFARIHETNLKKQGLLPLTFANAADYEKIKEADLVDIVGLKDFAPSRPLTMIARHQDGSRDEIVLKHSFNAEQIAWFKAGSALNLLKTAAKRQETATAAKKKAARKAPPKRSAKKAVAKKKSAKAVRKATPAKKQRRR
jgi:aconitate hydratase